MKHFLHEFLEEAKDSKLNVVEIMTSLIKKAEFQIQDLTGGMFIPCGLDGNPLIKPDYFEESLLNLENGDWTEEDIKTIQEYQDALGRVLFQGFELGTNIDEYYTAETEERMFTFRKDSGEYHGEAKVATICEMGFELTEAGLKAYGE